MKNLLVKECRLTASPLSYLFILFGVMAMIPGYPILLGAFFICFGIFHSYQSGRENNDILYTVLLPVKKSDAVRAKYIFAVLIQMAGFLLMIILTAVRMKFLGDADPFVNNPMMNANPAYLAWNLIVFLIFNLQYIPGFFKTAYKFGAPFIWFLILSFVVIGVAETLHHVPGLTFLNATADPNGTIWGKQFVMLAAAAVLYISGTVAGMKKSIRLFEKVDL